MRRLFPNSSKSTLALNEHTIAYPAGTANAKEEPNTTEAHGPGEALEPVELCEDTEHLDTYVEAPGPVVEPDTGDAPYVEISTASKNKKRFILCIESIRCRPLQDPDNFAGGVKYLVDACRAARLIPDDTGEILELKLIQKPCETRGEERTVVTVIQPHLRT
jgi:hypothetical protein